MLFKQYGLGTFYLVGPNEILALLLLFHFPEFHLNQSEAFQFYYFYYYCICFNFHLFIHFYAFFIASSYVHFIRLFIS